MSFFHEAMKMVGLRATGDTIDPKERAQKIVRGERLPDETEERNLELTRDLMKRGDPARELLKRPDVDEMRRKYPLVWLNFLEFLCKHKDSSLANDPVIIEQVREARRIERERYASMKMNEARETLRLQVLEDMKKRFDSAAANDNFAEPSGDQKAA